MFVCVCVCVCVGGGGGGENFGEGVYREKGKRGKGGNLKISIINRWFKIYNPVQEQSLDPSLRMHGEG